jgi:hypothetical protein
MSDQDRRSAFSGILKSGLFGEFLIQQAQATARPEPPDKARDRGQDDGFFRHLQTFGRDLPSDSLAGPIGRIDQS